jgi:hypothetical protein
VFRRDDEVGEIHTGRNTLDTATTSKTTNSWLRDSLDVVAENLSVTLGSTFAEAFATLSTCEDALVRCIDDDIIVKG